MAWVYTRTFGEDPDNVHFNVGNYCHFPSFGKGWFDEVMENGDRVQMGVECENDWNYEDHSLAKKGENCRLICKNLSGTDNVYKPIKNEDAHFKCQSPIPIFAFQSKNCHKDLGGEIQDKIYGNKRKPFFYDECYDDWFKMGLNLGVRNSDEWYMSCYDCYSNKYRDPEPVA